MANRDGAAGPRSAAARPLAVTRSRRSRRHSAARTGTGPAAALLQPVAARFRWSSRKWLAVQRSSASRCASIVSTVLSSWNASICASRTSRRSILAQLRPRFQTTTRPDSILTSKYPGLRSSLILSCAVLAGVFVPLSPAVVTRTSLTYSPPQVHQPPDGAPRRQLHRACA